VWVALVPDGAAQPVSPVKTALVFLAGDPVPSGTTITTHTADGLAYFDALVNLVVSAKDAHGNVVPGWVLAQEVNVAPDQDVFRMDDLLHDDDSVYANLELKHVSSDVLVSEKVRKAVTNVTVGPNVTARVDTSLVADVGICLDPGDDGSGYPRTARPVYVGVSTWRLCVYDEDKFNGYSFKGYVPKELEATYDATLHSNDFADGEVIGQKLKFKTGLSWSSAASHGAKSLVTATQTVRDLYQANDLNNPGRALVRAGVVWDGGTHTSRTPTIVEFFTGYSSWSSSDRDRDNMGASAREICKALGAVEDAIDLYRPTAATLQAALDVNPEAAAMVRVNTYGGGHDLIIYNGVPGDRGNGYYPIASYGPLGDFPVYGIWNKKTVTAEVIGSKLNQNVQGAYCAAL
ncbi:hypothetical protein M1186_24025, partial [Salmonella enterica subsp. enterica serovar Minnesota]|uniref:hypothetical protein n=1 Tax=Salmonella enterica TaxID=28901 RepID=UPI0021B32AE5